MASFGGIDNHTLTLISDGRFVAVGSGVTGSPSNTVTFGTLTGSALYTVAGTNYPIAIGYTTATALPDGRLLVVGGTVGSGGTTPDATVYFGTISGNSISWAAGTSLPTATGVHTLTLLSDGRVLVVGGATPSGLTANSYLGTISGNNIAWVSSTAYPVAVELHTMTLLGDGTVLGIGGFGTSHQISGVWIGTISGSSISWASVASFPYTLCGHTATLISPTSVMVTGGTTSGGAFQSAVRFASVVSGSVSYASGTSLPTAMLNGSAALAGAGVVLLAGGVSSYSTETPIDAQVLTVSGTTVSYATTTTGSGPSVAASAALVSSPDVVAAVSPVPVTASAALVSSPDVVVAVSPVPFTASAALVSSPDVVAAVSPIPVVVVSTNFFTNAKYAAGANLTYSMGNANASAMQYSASVGTRLIYSFSNPDTIRYAAGAKFSATISVPTNDTIKYSAGAGIRYAAIKQQADTIKYSAGAKFSAKLMEDIGGKYSAATHLSYSITTDTKANYGVGAKLKYSMLAGDGIAYKAGGRLTYSIVSSADNIAYKVGARIKYSISPASGSIRYSAGAKFSGYLSPASDMKYNAGFGVGIDYNIDFDYQDTLTYKACTSLKYYVDGSDKLAYRLKTATSYRANIDVTVDPPSYYQ